MNLEAVKDLAGKQQLPSEVLSLLNGELHIGRRPPKGKWRRLSPASAKPTEWIWKRVG